MASKIRFWLNKYWIRKDREQYFLSGVIITSVIAAFTASYWHFSDRINLTESKIQIKTTKGLERKKEFERFKESTYISEKGIEKYYRPDQYIPVPKPETDEDETGN